MRLQGVHCDEDGARDEELSCAAGEDGVDDGEKDQGQGQRVEQEPRQGGREVVVPRRDAPVGGLALDGVVVEARELGPEPHLPEVRVQRHREGEGGGKGHGEGRDEGPQGELAGEEEVGGRGDEEDGYFGAEDGSGDGEACDGLLAVTGGFWLRGGCESQGGGQGSLSLLMSKQEK